MSEALACAAIAIGVCACVAALRCYGRRRYRSGLIDGMRVNVAAYRRFHDAMRGLGWEMGETMTAGASDEPIPCPFCGGSGLRSVPSFVDVHPPLDPDGCLALCQTDQNGFCILCTDCRMWGPRVEVSHDRAYPKTVAAWNGRTTWE